MKVMRHGDFYHSSDWLGRHVCEECGCLFKLTRKDSHLIKLLDGDLSTSCPECKNRVNVSKPLVDYIY